MARSQTTKLEALLEELRAANLANSRVSGHSPTSLSAPASTTAADFAPRGKRLTKAAHLLLEDTQFEFDG